MEKIRTFIAIELPESIQAGIGKLQAELKRMQAAVSWVKYQNIHLTLKFLGDVAADQIPAIIQSVARAAQTVPGFKISVQGAGFFPNAKRPRVFWVGCEATAGYLAPLHQALEQELLALNFEKEDRPFSPHLTIGRVKGEFKVNTVVRKIQATEFLGGEFAVTELVIMQSQLHPSGSIYTPLGKVPLMV
ncbi:RNA 2',3'-cyclic phosphodiesterase [candidate division KSB1 bacterium]|nr:RNA 2',3'-cyclic phosphodiesterase [candidate division KSB1 bacterium]